MTYTSAPPVTPVVVCHCVDCQRQTGSHGAYAGVAFLKVGTLDDRSWAAPEVEIWRGSAPPWTPVFEGTQVFERDPPTL